MSHLQNHLQLFHVLESLWKTILRLETNLEEGKAVLVPVGEGIFVCVCVYVFNRQNDLLKEKNFIRLPCLSRVLTEMIFIGCT